MWLHCCKMQSKFEYVPSLTCIYAKFLSKYFSNINGVWFVWFSIQDFADLLSQPSLEGPADTEAADYEEDHALQDAAETSPLSISAMNTLVQLHQSMCLGYAQSLWYQRTPPTNHSKEHIKALISSLQIASPVMSHFYHLLGL